MPTRFEHVTLAQRVVMDTGRAAERLDAELDRLAPRAVMLVAGQRHRRLVDRIGARIELHWSEVTQHVPVELVDRAATAADGHGIDAVITIGGGSAIGLGKAIALRRAVRLVAVPTTYAGSEATDVWGLTDASGKRTGADARVLPETVIYDAQLTGSMPAELAVASGLNAVAHCVDSLWGPRADPINAALAGEGLRALHGGLIGIATATGAEVALREQTQYGCYLAAVAMTSAGTAMHHKICHVLGGRFGLPHAATHAVVLPYVLAWNAPAAPAAAKRIAQSLDAGDAVTGLEALRTRLGAPRSLRELGMHEADLAAALGPVLAAIPPSNPRPIDERALQRLLHAAWSGADVATVDAVQAR